MQRLELRKLNPQYASVKGRDLSIEEKTTGKVYISSKPYIDKLFNEIGFGNLNVIKILEDFAGKVVSDIGVLTNSNIYIDDNTDSFIVTSENAINWINSMYERFEEEGFTFSDYRTRDNYYQWDQLCIKSKVGTYFVLYIDMCNELVQVLSLKYDENNISEPVLIGVINEGSYLFGESGSLDNLILLMQNPIDASVGINMDEKLSFEEYMNLLCKVGYATRKRGGKYYLTDEGINLLPLQFEFIFDDYNMMSWLKRKITPIRLDSISNYLTFKDAYNLISEHLYHITFWDIYEYYTKNANEQSDMFLIK